MPGEARWLFAVIDGLGHGPDAASAAEAAADFIQTHAQLPLEPLLRGCDRAIARTRGAAVTIVRVAPILQQLEHVAVGNVEFTARSRHPIRPIARPGIVGRRFRNAAASVYTLSPGDRFAICTDGVSSRFHLDELTGGPPLSVARRILAQHGKGHDDAACLVVELS